IVSSTPTSTPPCRASSPGWKPTAPRRASREAPPPVDSRESRVGSFGSGCSEAPSGPVDRRLSTVDALAALARRQSLVEVAPEIVGGLDADRHAEETIADAEGAARGGVEAAVRRGRRVAERGGGAAQARREGDEGETGDQPRGARPVADIEADE